MRAGDWLRPPRRLWLLLLGMALIPAVAVAWLSWRLLQQERALESQRVQESLESAADLVAAQLRQQLSAVDDLLGALADRPNLQLRDMASPLGPNGLVVIFAPGGIQAHPWDGLVYYPKVPATSQAPVGSFAGGEELEYQRRDYASAALFFAALARSQDPAVRAGALLRLARNLRKGGRPAEALPVYQEMAKAGSARIEETPVDLLALYSRCELLEQLERSGELRTEAARLYRDLQSGRWQLTRGVYYFYAEGPRRWAGFPVSAATQAGEQRRLALTGAVESLWQQWRDRASGDLSASGRRALAVQGQPVLVLWRLAAERLAAAVAMPEFLEEPGLGAIRPLLRRRRLRLAVTDAAGLTILGDTPPPTAPSALCTPAEIQLPWTVHVVSSDPDALVRAMATRRRLRLAGFGSMLLVLLAGFGLTARAAFREVELARLKSDFVAAVSHEFRSPLSIMRQLTDMLVHDRVPGDQRRRQYYEVLGRETNRLERLVEDLLNFGRMEAGTLEYRREPLDPSGLVRDVAAEFQLAVQDRGYRVEVDGGQAHGLIRADREALGRALWNLLDNAVRYSPDCRTVWVDVASGDGKVLIRVRDRGIGIPAAEQKQIFSKFVRGRSGKLIDRRGAGIGLAIVDHVVKAHGGEVRLESRPGHGSTFTIVLPQEG